MAISLCGLTAPELPADLCLPGHGRRALRDCLPGSGTPAGTWLVTGGRRAARQSARSYRAGAAHLEPPMALGNCSHVPHERLYLVDTFYTVSLRCLACLHRNRALILNTTQRHKSIMIVVPWRWWQTPGGRHKLVTQWPNGLLWDANDALYWWHVGEFQCARL